jgi:protein-tyrosine phosphatase
MPSILMICTANQFRSPIAAACLKKELGAALPGEIWLVESAGTWAVEGLPASRLMLKLAGRLGLDGLAEHLTRQVSAHMLEDFDLLIVMDSGHKEALSTEFPYLRERIYLLTEISGCMGYDIPDPAIPGASANEIAYEISSLVKTGREKIMQLARALHG